MSGVSIARRVYASCLVAGLSLGCNGEKRNVAPSETADKLWIPESEVSVCEVESAPAPAPPAPTALTKRGVFIWEFGKRAPTPERSAELLASWGVGRVFIKNSEGAGGVRVREQVKPPPRPGSKAALKAMKAALLPSASASASASASSSAVMGPPISPHRWNDNFSPDNIKPFLERHIEVWGFGYFYPDNFVDKDGISWGSLEDQVKMSVGTLSDGVTGVIVDAEVEFEDQPGDAAKLCKLLRAQLGTKKLAYTTFGWISAHRRFPFKVFDEGCGDAFLPQVYFDFGWPGGAQGSLAKLNRDIADLGLKAPVWPVQSNDGKPNAADMQFFLDQSGPDSSIFYLHKEESWQTAMMSHLHY